MADEVRYGGTQLLIDKVSLALGGRLILREVTAEIKDVIRPGATQGQVVALLGPSGIGKTQLLHIIAGLRPPDLGRVLVPFDARTFQEVDRGLVGMVYQNYPLFEHRTVMGNLVLAAQQQGCRGLEVKARVFEMLDRFDLASYGMHYPAQLSGGQRQRVAIAQQLLCGEHLLLLDEPFSGLDPVMEDHVCKLIQELAAADELNTILVVTHDVTAAAAVADHIWLMGRDRDAKGGIIPGARIVQVYDLIALGLCWHPDLVLTAGFGGFVSEIKARFRTL